MIQPTISAQEEKKSTEKVEKVQKGLFKKKKKILWLFPTEKEIDMKSKELLKKAPILLYIKNDLTADVYKNVKPGYIKPDKTKEFNNEIQSRKRIELNYGDTKIPIYIMYEEERFCYPVDPQFDAKAITRSLRNIKQNYKDYEEKTNGLKGWSMSDIKKIGIIFGGAIGILIAGLYLGNILGVWELLGWFQGTATQVIQTVTNETINNTLPGGGAIIMP